MLIFQKLKEKEVVSMEKDIEEILQTASRCVLFSDVEELRAFELLSSFLEKGEGEIVEFAKGAIIFSPESYSCCLGIITAGNAIVTKEESFSLVTKAKPESYMEKSHPLLLQTLQSSDCFGVATLFADPGRYVSTIYAKTACQVLFLPLKTVKLLFALEPAIAISYAAFLSGRIQFLNRKIDTFTASNPEHALLSYLQEQSTLANSLSFRLPVSYSKLAEILHLGRSSLYRSLETLEDQRLLIRDGRNITLCLPCIM